MVWRKQNHLGGEQTPELQKYFNLPFCGQREKLDLKVLIMVQSWYVHDDEKYSALGSRTLCPDQELDLYFKMF